MSISLSLKEAWSSQLDQLVLNDYGYPTVRGETRRSHGPGPYSLGVGWHLLRHPRTSWRCAEVRLRLEREPRDPWIGAMLRTSYWGPQHPVRRHLWLQPLPCVALHVWWTT